MLTDARGGMQEFGVVFVMPSGDMGSWSLTVSYEASGTSHQVSVPVSIALPEQARMTTLVLEDESKLFVSLVSPLSPEVGANDIEFTIHKKASMMDWPAVENYGMAIEPEMPAMGHGSPNNENPVHKTNGHYKGIVNFTMTGEWLINVELSEGDAKMGETAFTIIL
jgi:hypothetical protein